MPSGRIVFLSGPNANLGFEETSCPSFPAAPTLTSFAARHESCFAPPPVASPMPSPGSAVSERVTLSAAQLAVAREYGFPSWPALRAEAERRRRLSESRAHVDPLRTRITRERTQPSSRRFFWAVLRSREGAEPAPHAPS
jgi:hypothetical protein